MGHGIFWGDVGGWGDVAISKLLSSKHQTLQPQRKENGRKLSKSGCFQIMGKKKKRIKDSYLKIIFQTAKKKQSSTPRGFWCHNANFWWINGEKSDDEEEIRKKQTLSWIGIFMDSLALTCESFGSRSCCFGCSILRLHESSQDELAL